MCKGKLPFHAPSELVDAFLEGNVVLFVGAGVSTEAPRLLHYTLQEHISYLIGNKDSNRPFPDIMQDYCDGPHGRTALLQQIRDRIDYIYSHRDLYQDATRFHRQLATFFPIDTIVTTNWDTYFEDECGATAFVNDEDLAFWDIPKRKVLKLHGTIANFGSMIATRVDYKKCTRKLRSGLLGARLKSLLATRAIVFIGYSLRDDDFLQIFRTTRKQLAQFNRQAYFVSPHLSKQDRTRLRAIKMHLIETDGEFFITQLKQHAQSQMCINSDDIYEDTDTLLSEVIDAHLWIHDTFNIRKYPQILISSWYQDGLMDVLHRVLRQRRTGEYSNLRRVIGSASGYFEAAKLYARDRSFADAAYCQGYATGLLFVSQRPPNRIFPPLFFHFSEFGTSSKTAYKRALSKLPALHKRAQQFVTKTIAKAPPHEDVVFHHRAQLNLGRYFDFHEDGTMSPRRR